MTSSDNTVDKLVRDNAKIMLQTSTDIIRARAEFEEIATALKRIDSLLIIWPQYYPQYREDLNHLGSAAKRRFQELERVVNDINCASLAGRKYECFRDKSFTRRIQAYERETSNLSANHPNYAMELQHIETALLFTKKQQAWPWYVDDLQAPTPFWIKEN